MKKDLYSIAHIFLLISVISCKYKETIELPASTPHWVVEGWINDGPGPYKVKITETLPFETPNNNPSVSHARVSIVTNHGGEFQLRESEEHPGEYFTDSATFRGRAGVQYQLLVQLGNKTITSEPELLKPAPPFDTLTYTFLKNIQPPEPSDPTSGYLVTGFVTDSVSQNDYYRWKVTANGNAYDAPENLILLTDRFVNGRRFGFQISGILFQEFDTVRIRQLMLSETSFKYLRNLYAQVTDYDKLTRIPPAPVQGNLRNLENKAEIILGYFGVSGVSEATVVIQKK